MADIPLDNLIVFNSCICCASGLYTTMPDCLGCSGQAECLCCVKDFCLKSGAAPMPCMAGAADGFLFKIGAPCCSVGFKAPTICCKGKNQCCCMVGAGEFPPGTDVPMMCSYLFIVCYPKFGVWQTFAAAK
ncbi:hypothetical protein B484DRAFT_361353 [Ochromonadaceae sp. CCMP2298]|nr:hypothetical protein B484DRAFT_361353 [Ochromonadaceae sp. CCMP2298]|mmetsp:Transcript_19939/g.44377  ORF Transcript_19939/g.44377 Transcript_19939/m.44377 type:complete len:131 (-) Transcript_19939:84-476(-)